MNASVSVCKYCVPVSESVGWCKWSYTIHVKRFPGHVSLSMCHRPCPDEPPPGCLHQSGSLRHLLKPFNTSHAGGATNKCPVHQRGVTVSSGAFLSMVGPCVMSHQRQQRRLQVNEDLHSLYFKLTASSALLRILNSSVVEQPRHQTSLNALRKV